jgi:hypothetical protein
MRSGGRHGDMPGGGTGGKTVAKNAQFQERVFAKTGTIQYNKCHVYN